MPILVLLRVWGFKIPLKENWWSSDLARDLNLPVILVVGFRLGCHQSRDTYE